MSISRVLGTVSGNTALPQLDYDELIAAGVHVPEFIERNLDCDFSFDLGDPVTFRSRINSAVLDTTGKGYVLEDNAAGKYLRIEEGGLNGLIGPTEDAREMTYAGLFNFREPDPDAVHILAGSATELGDDGGEYLGIVDSGRIILNVRGEGIKPEAYYSELSDAGVGFSTNDFVFIAATSRITSGSTTEHTLFIGAGTPIVKTDTGTKELSTSNRTIALGNAYNGSSGYDAMKTRCARFLTASRSSTVAELTAMYARAKIVAARRGITVR